MRNKGFKFSCWGPSVLRISVCSVLFCAVLMLAAASVVRAQTPPPALFFSDLTVAPNSGGESVSGYSGAYVTLYGNNFGSSQGTSTVTWNGQNCLRVVPATGTYAGWGTAHLWYQEIIVQLGTSCTPGTGSFVVTTASGSSDGLSFTVNAIGSNHIYFVSTSGNDSNTGTAAAPFKTMTHCMGSGDTSSVERAGDVCYVENGVNQTSLAGFGALTPNAYAGTATAPLAMLTYPGASSTIGANSMDKGIEDCVGYSPQCNTANDQYLVLGGFHVRGKSYAVSIQGSHNRIVALEVQCPSSPNGDNLGCFNTISNYETVLGNEVSNTGMDLAPGGTCGKLCHSMYIGYTGGNGYNYEIGWNSSHDVNGGRNLQFYNGSAAGYNISIHDNRLYNNVGVDGMTVDADADLGYVNIYNNLIYNVCQKPDEGGSCTCIYLQNTAGSPTAYEQVYNNTMYGCSHSNTTSYGMFSPLVRANFVNNIVYSTLSDEPLIATSCSGCASNLTGSNNIWFGGTGVPSQTKGNITADPLFVTNGSNFVLQASSPAIGAGIPSWTGGGTTTYDIDGLLRSNPPSIGALEFTSATAPTRPNPPTNLNLVVN
jgi:hypothetical protein